VVTLNEFRFLGLGIGIGLILCKLFGQYYSEKMKTTVYDNLENN